MVPAGLAERILSDIVIDNNILPNLYPILDMAKKFKGGTRMSAAIRKSKLLFFIVGCIFCPGCGDDSPTDSDKNVRNTDYVASEPFDFEVDVVDHTGLRMNVINGSINLVGVEGLTSVSIMGEKSAGSESMEDAEEHLQFLQVNVLDSCDEILIETEQPDIYTGRSYIVDFNIQIPQDFTLDITSINGSADINSIDSDIALSLVNGQIVFGEISGSVTVDIDKQVICLISGIMIKRNYRPYKNGAEGD